MQEKYCANFLLHFLVFHSLFHLLIVFNIEQVLDLNSGTDVLANVVYLVHLLFSLTLVPTPLVVLAAQQSALSGLRKLTVKINKDKATQER